MPSSGYSECPFDAGRREEGGDPVHRDRELRGNAARRDHRRPRGKQRHANAALEQVHLLADERPGVGEALAAVVAGEHDQRVLRGAGRLQRVEDPADAFVHVMNHRAIGLDRAAVQVMNRLGDAPRLGLVIPRHPRPVRRGVVHAQQERLARASDELDRAIADEIGQIAGALDLGPVLEEVVVPARVAMAEVVDPAAQRAEVLGVAALQRTEVRRKAEVPLAGKRRRVAGVAQQRRQRRMRRRQAQIVPPARLARDRLLGRAPEAILVAAGHQRKARGRAHRRVGIAVGEAQPGSRHRVEARRRGARAP